VRLILPGGDATVCHAPQLREVSAPAVVGGEASARPLATATANLRNRVRCPPPSGPGRDSSMPFLDAR
jgi:hypothetical protein